LQRLSAGQFARHNVWGSFGPQLIWYSVLLVLGGVVLWRINVLLIWKLEMLVTRDMYHRMFAHLLDLSASFHANRFGGSLVSQASKFTSGYVRIADTTIFSLLPLLWSFVFASIVLWRRSAMAVTLLLAFSAIFMTMAVLLTRRVRVLNAIESSKENTQTGFLADAIANVLAIKSFAGGAFERKRFAGATAESMAATNDVMWASTKRDTVFSGMTQVLCIGALAIAVIGVVQFNADVGTVFLIVTYTTMIAQHLWDFCQSTLRNYNRAFGEAQEMTEILQIQPGIKDPARPEKVRIHKGRIELRDVTFAHAESADDEALFQQLSLDIRAGEKIGLVGHSGSGKTSLTKLLLRFNDVDDGEILIDGQNIAHITQDDLRRNIAYVPQEPLLFHRTIRENIAYGQSDASDQAIKQASRKAHADDFITKLPSGYDTLVGERGVKLSGGQRQRIAIARAILKDAPILVLDEATSALDSESEGLIQQALWELMKDRTAIVIAHRLSTVQKMDRIVVLQDGAIAEQGTHSELVKQNGIYAGLWAHQSGGFLKD